MRSLDTARESNLLRSRHVRVPRIELHPKTPWVLRLFDRVPLAAFWVGIVLATALFAVFLAYSWLFGTGLGRLANLHGDGNWLAEIIEDLFFGWTLAIAAASARGAQLDFEALRPALDFSAVDSATLRRQVLTYQPLPLALVAAASGIVVAVATPLDPSLWADGRFPGWAHPTAIWLAARNFANWCAVGFAMALGLMLGHAFSRLGDHLRVDLLDRAPLAPFAHRALRNVSWWMLLAAFLSLHYAGRGWAGELLPLALLSLAAFALGAFTLPLLGAHRSIRARKEAELARVRAAIRDARERVLAAEAAERLAGGRLADLVAYEGRIAAVPEWPLDASTLVRLGFYLMLGLGSWVGAAIVEWLVDAVLRR